MSNKEVLLRHIAGIMPVNTSHGVGEKRIIATGENAGSNITQIARTKLNAGEKIEMHVHQTMDEHFFFLEGKCMVNVDGDSMICIGEDYLLIPAGIQHELNSVADTVMITIGIVVGE